MTNRPKQSNEKSMLLNDNENDAVFNLLDRSCCSLATAVVQVYHSQSPNGQKWNKRFCGVVCFVKDNPKRSYFIRLYDLKNQQMLTEQEIYTQFKYKCPRDYFHTFEGDDCQVGLNFASEHEASKFKQAVEGKLLERAKKRMEKKKQQGGGKSSAPPANQSNMGTITVGNGTALSGSNVALNKPAPVKENTSKSKKGGKDKKKKLTKEDISTPTDFRHVSHVGWDPNTGLDMKKLDPDMRALFEEIGINDQTQVDEETLDFIYEFVDKHGGINAVRDEMAKRPPPPPTQSHGAPPPPGSRPPPSTTSARPPPPPPSRAPDLAPPPPPHRGGAPPPPPPGRQGMPPPPPPSRSQGMPPPPPPSSRSGVPPPPPPGHQKYGGGSIPPPPPPSNIPPPPPPPSAPAPPPPPPVGGGGGIPPPPPPVGGNAGGRSALLNAIQKGTTLKKSDTSSGGGGMADARDGLLSAIRGGATLKPVAHHESAAPAEPSGIAGALAHALAQRKNVIQGSDDEGSSDDVDDDDDEWDD